MQHEFLPNNRTQTTTILSDTCFLDIGLSGEDTFIRESESETFSGLCPPLVSIAVLSQETNVKSMVNHTEIDIWKE